MKKYLHVGGLVAAGFDASITYLLTISHSGRGVFLTSSWKRVAREDALAYPENEWGIGIGPIAGQSIPVTSINYEKGTLELTSPDGRIHLHYESGMIDVEESDGG